ncbi:MAG: TIGR01906 family membrane protein [Thermoflexales bacterium]|nr:TIGR01906 family membrane protein [Thermoflexales bacterium]
MKRWQIRLAQCVIIVAVPIVLAVLPARVVMQPWIIHFEYGRAGFPPDAFGMGQAERTRLALDGLESIAGPRGMEALWEARFDDGRAAFQEREIEHMLDVRNVAGQLFALQAACCVVLLVAAAGLYREREARPALAGALRSGALVTLVAVVGSGVFGLVAWNSFFTTFHQIFFSGDSWLFAYTDTLIRLYPIQFWIDVTALICAAIVLEALVLGAAAWWWQSAFSFQLSAFRR